MGLYDDTLNVLKNYMGPAAQKFLDRQIERLAIPKDNIGPHIGDLAGACKTSAALLLDDAKAAEIEQKIRTLA